VRLIVDGIIFTLQKSAGISRYFQELITRHSKDTSVEIEVLLLGKPSDALPLEVGRASVKFQRSRILERLRRVNAGVNPQSGSSAIFHSSYYRLPQQIGLPTVVTVHDMIHEKILRGPRAFLLAEQKKLAMRQARFIIAVSENTKRDILELYPWIQADKVVVVHNAASEAFTFLPDVERRKSLLFVGSRGGYKNFALCPHAMSLLPEYELEIVGGGPLQPRELEALNNHCPGRFRYHGIASDTELNKLYNENLALLYPSAYEGFGIPPIEAMRAGCVPIVRKASSLVEVLGNAGVSLQNLKVEEIVSAVRSLEEETNFLKFQTEGFVQAAKFSWQRAAEETLEVYRKALAIG